MKRTLLWSAIVTAALTSPAWSDKEIDVEVESDGPGAATVEISPEQRTHIREYVVKQKISPVKIESVSVGSVLPPDIELQAFPGDVGASVSTYRFVKTSDHVVLVEPSSRRVVQIIN
jgi:hypothetical protein